MQESTALRLLAVSAPTITFFSTLCQTVSGTSDVAHISSDTSLMKAIHLPSRRDGDGLNDDRDNDTDGDDTDDDGENDENGASGDGPNSGVNGTNQDNGSNPGSGGGGDGSDSNDDGDSDSDSDSDDKNGNGGALGSGAISKRPRKRTLAAAGLLGTAALLL